MQGEISIHNRETKLFLYPVLLCVAVIALLYPSRAQTTPSADTPVRRSDRNSQVAHEQLLEKKRQGKIDVYFEGDSITRRWGATDYPDFLANWKQNFYGWNAANFGWGGDTTQNILWRLENGELDGVNPKIIVILAGTNDVGRDAGDETKVADVTKGIKAVVDLCRQKAPRAKIILTALFPRNDGVGVMPTIDAINERIEKLADGRRIRFLNINDRLADKNGILFDGMMVDKLHPTLKGYQIWADALKPIFREILGPPANKDEAPPATGDPSRSAASSSTLQSQPTLKDAFKGSFLVGAALNANQFSGHDPRGEAIITTQFNSITPENVLKWALVHPRPDAYDFAAADRYVAFGEKNHMVIIGHTLVWHNQTPAWVFQDEKGNQVDRETLLKRMHEHIQTVVGRYQGRIKGWDVVNEALNEDGTMRQTPWMKIIGPDYIVKAFQYAHEADPRAQLYYNDYSLENEAKRNGAVELIKRLQASGVTVNAVGLQGHDKMDWPTIEQQDKTITTFASLGIKVNITELDIDLLPRPAPGTSADISQNFELQARLNPYPQGLPDSVQQALAKRYAELFTVFQKHRGVIDRVTFWGVTDGDSWLNNWPVRGRTSYPLLFNRTGQPKPAFDAVIKTAGIPKL